MSPASEIDFQRAAVVNAQLNEVVAKRENTSWYPKRLRAIYIRNYSFRANESTTRNVYTEGNLTR